MAKKKEFHEELPTKVCPQCDALCMEEAEVCDECGYSFVPQGDEKPTPEESQSIEDLFAQLDDDEPPAVEEPPAEETTPPEEVETPIDEIPVEEIFVDEAQETPTEYEEVVVEEPVLDENICPNCGSKVDEDALHCPTCGYQLREGEVVQKALIESLTDTFSLVESDEIDYSKAIFGEEIIVRKVGEKYEALTYTKDIPVKIIEANDTETEVLKADYTLRKDEELTTKKIIEAAGVVKTNPDYLNSFYGNSNIDEIYGEGLSEYAEITGIKDEIIDIGLPIGVMQILSELGAKAQAELGEIMKRYDVDDLTPTSAKLIVDSDRTEDTMRDIIVREKTMQSIVADYVDRIMSR